MFPLMRKDVVQHHICANLQCTPHMSVIHLCLQDLNPYGEQGLPGSSNDGPTSSWSSTALGSISALPRYLCVHPCLFVAYHNNWQDTRYEGEGGQVLVTIKAWLSEPSLWSPCYMLHGHMSLCFGPLPSSLYWRYVPREKLLPYSQSYSFIA